MPDYRCDQCETNQADFIVGVIMNGEQTYLCAPCLPKFANAIKRALADAVKAEQNAGVPAQEGAEPPDAEWEADYPQGRDKGEQAAGEAAQEVPGSDTETAPAPVE